MNKIKTVLFATAECFPFVKTGGLADVCCALPKEFPQEEWDIRVVLPNYSCIDEKYRSKFTEISRFYMSAGPAIRDKEIRIMTFRFSGITYYFVGNEEYFNSEQPYTQIRRDIEKFIFFDKAVLSMLPLLDFCPQIIHCHDWPTAMIPVFLKAEFQQNPFFRGIRTIQTVHNLKFQGIWDIKTFKELTGFSDSMFTPETMEYHKNANMLKGGLVFADYITTVSPTYCSEIQTEMFGEGLDGVLSKRHLDMQGILNGIDYSVWNPLGDTSLFYPYSKADWKEQKRKNKEALQDYLGLDKDGSKFMICMITKLIPAKGLDTVSACLEAISDDYTQFVVVGTGSPAYENTFRDFAWRYSGRFSANICQDEELSHRVIAAADAVLIPSNYSPCGFTQLISFRYGTVPIAHTTGGLRDTITAYRADRDHANAFSFARSDSEDLLLAVNFAKQMFFDRNEEWNRITERGMDLDYSWSGPQKQYAALYDYLIAKQ